MLLKSIAERVLNIKRIKNTKQFTLQVPKDCLKGPYQHRRSKQELNEMFKRATPLQWMNYS